MNTKTFRASIKSTNDATGAIEAYASTFGNIDLGGDVCVKGCFKATIKEAESRDRGFLWPMLWFHNEDQPPIGIWTSASEDATGLKVRGKINLESTLGREIYACVKQGSVGECSIGYSCAPGGYSYNKAGARELSAINLIEISLLTAGYAMNPQALVLSAKARKAAVGAVDMLNGHLLRIRAAANKNDGTEVRAAADDLEEWLRSNADWFTRTVAQDFGARNQGSVPTFAGLDNWGDPKSRLERISAELSRLRKAIDAHTPSPEPTESEIAEGLRRLRTIHVSGSPEYKAQQFQEQYREMLARHTHK